MPAARSGMQWQYRGAPAGQDVHMPSQHQSLQQPEDFRGGRVNAAGPELAQQQAHSPGQQPALWPNQVFRQQQASCTGHGPPPVHQCTWWTPRLCCSLSQMPQQAPCQQQSACTSGAFALQEHIVLLAQEMPQECPASQSSTPGPHQLPHQYHQPGEPLPASSLVGLQPQASQTDEINTRSQSMPAARRAVGRTLALPSSETQGDPLQQPWMFNARALLSSETQGDPLRQPWRSNAGALPSSETQGDPLRQPWRSDVPPLSPAETLSFNKPSQSLAGTAAAVCRLQGPSCAQGGAHGLAAAAALAAPAADSQGSRRVTPGTTSPVTSSRSRAPEQVGWTYTSHPLLLASRALMRPGLTGLTGAGRPSRCGAHLQTGLLACINFFFKKKFGGETSAADPSPCTKQSAGLPRPL